MDIEELSDRMTNIEQQHEQEVEDKVDKHMRKVTRSADAMEIVLSAFLIIPMVSALANMSYTTNPVAHAFYLGVAVIAIIGVVFVVLVKRVLIELIYIELATRGHGRDDE